MAKSPIETLREVVVRAVTIVSELDEWKTHEQWLFDSRDVLDQTKRFALRGEGEIDMDGMVDVEGIHVPGGEDAIARGFGTYEEAKEFVRKFGGHIVAPDDITEVG